MTEEYEIVELEYSEDDILYYLVDEDDNEVGFVIEEDGQEIECYYEEYDGIEFELTEAGEEESNAGAGADAGAGSDTGASTDADSNTTGTDPDPADYDENVEHGYLYKIASIAGHEGNKARKKAEQKLDVVRGKASVGAKKATAVASAKAKEAKAAADEMNLGITREEVSEMTNDLNALAKEGVATAKELKETYNDIMDNFGFLMPKNTRRK